jgi:hypothetical protein
MRSTMRVVVGALVLGAAACAGRVAPAPSAPAYDSYGHELVTIAPGVQVIANYEESIFYVDGAYWRYMDGQWYRSPLYTGGWIYVPPPTRLLRIKQPDAYAHHRPAARPTHQGRARTTRPIEPPKSMYHSPPRRLAPLHPPESRPHGSAAR